jgi:phage tail protein X
MALVNLSFPNNDTPLDMLLWVAFKRQVAGLVEDTYARNPGLAELGFWPPAGTKITVNAPSKKAPVPPPVLRLY